LDCNAVSLLVTVAVVYFFGTRVDEVAEETVELKYNARKILFSLLSRKRDFF